MKWTGRTLPGLTSWILAIALTVSPLMAQNAVAPSVQPASSQHDDGASGETRQPAEAAEVIPGGTNDPILESAVLPETKVAKAATELPGVAGSSTPSAVPLGAKPAAPPAGSEGSTKAPGESKWIITAVVVGTAIAVGIILLLRGWHKNKGQESQGPLGTIITAGTPSVGNH